MVRLLSSVNTRPCISAATAFCITAISGPLTNGSIKPPSPIPTSAIVKSPAGARPTTSVPIPKPTSALSEVTMLRLKPPHTLSTSDPINMPLPQTESIQPSSNAPLPKWSVIKSGISVPVGVKRKLSAIAKPISTSIPGQPRT